MPYIKKDDREYLDELLEVLADDRVSGRSITTPGELNYVITRICLNFINHRKNYASYNAVIGVLECAKQELYRRAVSVYEDKKIKENGDLDDFVR
jgi:hypothetical protein